MVPSRPHRRMSISGSRSRTELSWRSRSARSRAASLSPAAGSRGAKAARAVIWAVSFARSNAWSSICALTIRPITKAKATTARSAIRVTEAMKLWRQRLRTAWPSAVILVNTPPATSHLDRLRGLRYLRAAGTSLIWPAGGGHGREDRGCGRHARGGGGRRARERRGRACSARSGRSSRATARAARPRRRRPPARLASAARSSPRPPDPRSGFPAAGRSVRRRAAASPEGAVLPAADGPPSAGLPTIPVPQGGGGGGAGPARTRPAPRHTPAPPSQGGQAIDAAGNTVEQVGHQAPAVQPITDPVGRLTHQVADTCRRLPACP